MAVLQIIDSRRTIVCGACGAVDDDLGRQVADLEDQVGRLREAYELLDADVQQKRAVIAHLKAEQDGSPRMHPKFKEAMVVLETWQQLCKPSARELDSIERIRKVGARLKGGFTVDELQRAVLGYSRMPYVTKDGRSSIGQPREWRADVDLIFRDAAHVEAGIQLAEQQEERASITALARLPWRRVFNANRLLIVRALERAFGAGLDDEGWRKLWPCPRCIGKPDGAALPLTVFMRSGSARLVDCFQCGVTDEMMLKAVVDPRPLLEAVA